MPIATSDPIPFGEWLPDMGDFSNPGALTVTNCVVENDRYKPFSPAVESGNAVDGIVKGSFAYRDATGNSINFCATADKIYQQIGTTWTDVSRAAGGAYNTAEDGFWCFVNFGTKVIATNYLDDIQVFDVATDTEFSKLSATAPKCRSMFVANNYLVCLDIQDADGATPYRVRWSPLNAPAGDWTPAPATTGADFQDIYGGDYANVFGAALEDYNMIIQGRDCWRMDFVGGTDIFDFHPMKHGKGSILPRSCISDGSSVFFKGQDGFYEFDGTTLTPIGLHKIDEWFTNNLNPAFDYNLNVIIDPLRHNLMISFPDLDATDGGCNKILCYNYADSRFTLLEQESDLLATFLSNGLTLEELDNIDTNLDTLPFSLDSRYWQGGKTILGCFSVNHKLAVFAGDPLTATIGTGEVRLNSSGRSVLHSVVPYIDGGNISGRCGYRNRPNDPIKWTDEVQQNSMTGELDFTRDAVFHRLEVTISGDWEIATAVAARSPSISQYTTQIAEGPA